MGEMSILFEFLCCTPPGLQFDYL
ncbi:hypothetical protein BMETH_17055285961764, partial [methanotrophic bacterial endosymbiont of Bathymodiolus sp.]